MPFFSWDQSTKDTLRWVGIGALAFGVAYAASRAIKHFRQRGRERHEKSKAGAERMATQKSEYSEYYFDKESEIRFIEECLSGSPSLEEIYESLPSLARDEFIKYTKQIRKRRRLVRNSNEDQYVEIVLQYERDLEELISRSRQELLLFLNVNVEHFEALEEEEGVDEEQRLRKKAIHLLRQKLSSHTPQKRMSHAVLRQIVEEEIGFVENGLYNRLREKLQNEMLLHQNEILSVVQALLEDIIYEKFGYETEDIDRKMQEGFSELSLQRTACLNKMAKDIGGFNYSSLGSDDESQGNKGSDSLKHSKPTTAGKSGEDEDI